MLRSGYIFILAILFVGVVILLKELHFWAAVGLSEPAGYLWQGFLFLGLLLFLQNALFNPYLRALEEREEQTIHKTKRAEATQQDAEAMVESYGTQLEEARHRGIRERERIALAAEGEEKETLARVKQEGQEGFRKSLEALEAEEKAAHQKLKTAQTSLAQDILAQVLGGHKSTGGGRPKLVPMEAKKGS
jgi:F0F1-type ATP synthase membrane subunit b/b'